MSIPTHWTIVERRRTFVHGGVAKKTPPRWINEVVLQHVKHTRLQFALINSHYVANAYNGDKLPALQDLWNEHKRLHKNRVLAHYNAGRPVIWTGDVNRRGYTTATGNSAEKQVFTGGIDRINWMPGDASVQLQFQSRHTVPMHVDRQHDAMVAIFRIRLT